MCVAWPPLGGSVFGTILGSILGPGSGSMLAPKRGHFGDPFWRPCWVRVRDRFGYHFGLDFGVSFGVHFRPIFAPKRDPFWRSVLGTLPGSIFVLCTRKGLNFRVFRWGPFGGAFWAPWRFRPGVQFRQFLAPFGGSLFGTVLGSMFNQKARQFWSRFGARVSAHLGLQKGPILEVHFGVHVESISGGPRICGAGLREGKLDALLAWGESSGGG